MVLIPCLLSSLRKSSFSLDAKDNFFFFFKKLAPFSPHLWLLLVVVTPPAEAFRCVCAVVPPRPDSLISS